MTEISDPTPDYASQLRANWHVLSDPASLRSAGLTAQQPTPAVLASLPAGDWLVAGATAAGASPLQIVKYVEIVNGKVAAIWTTARVR